MTSVRNRRGTTARRGGATLTEVLMALMVMGLGLVGVAALFPLSLLRSVEATKLTNATLTRINAESRIKASVSQSRSGIPNNFAIVQDPDGDGTPIRLNDFPSKFVFDPLGSVILSDDGKVPTIGSLAGLDPVLGNATVFGDFDGDGDADGDDFNFDYNEDGRPDAQISRYTFGYNAIDTARNFVTLPDSFVTLADALGPGTPSATTVRIPGVNLVEYDGTAGLRVTLIHAGSPQSDVRGASAITYDAGAGASVITLSTPMSSSMVGNAGRVTVELPEQRYTWVATVRRVGTRPSVTIAVFFRRSFDIADERVYRVDEPPGSYNEFELTQISGPDLNNDGNIDAPAGLKVGGYMFDVNSFRWLKIASREQVDADTIRFTTDPEDVDPSPRSRPGVPAMFPNNVVEAYTLKKE